MAQFIADQAAAALLRISLPSAPTLTATVLGSSQVRLTWTTPASPGASAIADYGYQRSSDGGRTWHGGYAGPASARSMVISGLTNGVTYQFRLAARNSVGWGTISNTVTVTPRVMAPSAPTLTASVVGSSQIRLTWTAPTFTGGAAIADYGYQRSSDGGRTWLGGYAGTASARSAVISGLTNGVTYQFRLAARNSVGWGAISNTITVAPRVMAPSAPTLAASVVGSGQIRLTWTAPTFTGGAAIADYGYQRSSDGGRTWLGGYAGTASARSTVISGLTNGVTYQFRLAARNSVGWGAISNTVASHLWPPLRSFRSRRRSIDSEPATSEADEHAAATSVPTTSPPDTTEVTTVVTTEPAESSEPPTTQEPSPPSSTIGDLVWIDVDLDGVQDVGEPGLGGIVVRLIDADGDRIAEDVDGSIGPLRTSDLCRPGRCRSRSYSPTATHRRVANVGTDDAIDSDIEPGQRRGRPCRDDGSRRDRRRG